ncbi:MAG: potassium channel family protein [Brevinematia bacterium]
MNRGRRLFLLFTLMVLLISSGTIGYYVIEKWNILDSIYMTVIVLTTIGFHEVHPLSTNGRIFTIIFSIFGFISFIGIISLISVSILEEYLHGNFRRKQMEKKLKDFKNHIIVCGLGRIGHYVIEELIELDEDFVGIDADEKVVNKVLDNLNLKEYIGIVGDATEEEILIKAGIERAKALICCVRDDVRTLFISLTAKKLNPDINIVSFVIDEKTMEKLRMIGVRNIISGDYIVAKKLVAIASDKLRD